MNNNTYIKGSEWGIWDLHIHSPATFLNNQFTNDWDNWCNKLIEKNIKVIGLTNYFRFGTINDTHEIKYARQKF